MGYTKLFSDIVMSTVWQEADHVRLVWITMLAIKDRWHGVQASIPGLAKAAGVTFENCEKAIDVLSSPDPHSRTTENEGRRIKKIDGGWLIINGEKFRNKMSLDERREYQRIKQREYREKAKEIKACHRDVDNPVNASRRFIHTEADADTDTEDQKHTSTDEPLTPPLSDVNRKIPYSEFIAVQVRCCSSLPKPLVVTDSRRKQIKRSWTTHPEWQFWESFWAIVERSDFLTGRGPPRPGHEKWRATIDWCLKEANFVKILEGNYDNR